MPYIKLLTLASLCATTLVLACRALEVNFSALPSVEVPVGRKHFDHIKWRLFLQQNLHKDLEPWKRRAPLKAKDVLDAYNKTMRRMYVPAVVQLILVYNNRLYWVNRPDPNGGEPVRSWSSSFNIHLHRRLVPALASGKIRLPNALFIYNSDDNAPRLNSPHVNLSVPLFSLIKSVGLEPGDDMDILVPQMFLIQTSMFTVPWHLKQDRAFFRGIGFCSAQWKRRYGFEDSCARIYLSYLSQRDERYGNGTALDCALVEEWKHMATRNASVPERLLVRPRVPFSHHAAYRWLLHLEGITASSRLGQLFMTNSLVLFQRSPWIEYFYRSLRPWHHYVPFWNATAPDGSPLGMDDVYGTLEAVRRLEAERPAEVQRMIAEANSFAVEFLTPHARLMYLQAAVTEYRALFPDMDAFLERYVADLRAKGWDIP